MYSIKQERTGRILKATFDHEISTLESYKTKKQAEEMFIKYRKALEEKLKLPHTFEDKGDTEFVLIHDEPDYNTTERFYIEEE